MVRKRSRVRIPKWAPAANWVGPLDELRRKKEILARHCEAEGRDPKSILLAIGSPILLVENEAQARAAQERIPLELQGRIASTTTVDQASERLQPYLDAGFQGVAFNYLTLPTPASMALAGELVARLTDQGR